MSVPAAATPPPAAHPSAGAATAGALLRTWRHARRLSQLALALDADISLRHLSYVETGRARPSRELLIRLAGVLDIPLRERNALLVSGGYAPVWFESGLGAPEMAQARAAIELILRHHEPYPAFVMDRHWNVLMSNDASKRFRRFMLGEHSTEANIVKLVLHPDHLRPLMANWEEAAEDLIRHLHNQIAAAPSDDRARALLAEVLAYPDVPARWRLREIGAQSAPLMTTRYCKDGVAFGLFSTVTTFGTPHDVTLDELRIECGFPADAGSAEVCGRLFGG